MYSSSSVALSGAVKAGGGWQRQVLIDAELAVDSSGDDLFAVDEAETRLAAEHPWAARLVHRFYPGQTPDEAAAPLGPQPEPPSGTGRTPGSGPAAASTAAADAESAALIAAS